jgi:hypothetical protein
MAHDEATKAITAFVEGMTKHFGDHPHPTGRRNNHGKAPHEAKTADEQSVTGPPRISRNKRAYLTTKRLEDCMIDILNGIGDNGAGRLSFMAKCEEIKKDHLEREEREKDAAKEKSEQDTQRATTSYAKTREHMARDQDRLKLLEATMAIAQLRKNVDSETYDTAMADSKKQASEAAKPAHLPVHNEEAHPDGMHDTGPDLQKELAKGS